MTEVVKYSIYTQMKDAFGTPYFQLYTSYNTESQARSGLSQLMRPGWGANGVAYVIAKETMTTTREFLSEPMPVPAGNGVIADQGFNDFDDDWDE